MGASDSFDLLVTDVYDAALNAALWPGVMEKICHFVVGYGAGLLVEDRVGVNASMRCDYGHDPYWSNLYYEKYVTLNPLPRIGIAYPIGVAFSQYDLMSVEEFRATQFYKEWIKPQGIIDVVVVNLEKTATSFGALVVTRLEQHGYVDAETLKRVERIAPHLRRSVLIGNTISFHKSEAAALSGTLSSFSAAVFLVGPNGRVVFANEAAQSLLRAGTILRDGQGSLTATNLQSDRMLREAITAAGGGDANLGARGVAIELTAPPEERWLAHVLPLTSGTRRETNTSHSAVAAVFVRKAALDLQFPLETLGKLYKLTPGEIRVLQGIVEIGGVPAIAEKYGISEGTVRTHLKSIFDKTGAERQADLIKLVATHAPPFGS